MCALMLLASARTADAQADAPWVVSLVTAESGQRVVEAGPVPASLLDALRRDFDRIDWPEILALYVADQDGAPTPMLGRHELTDRGVRFVPRFSLRAGLAYRAELNVARLTLELGGTDAGDDLVVARLEVPAAPPAPPSRLEAIYPSADVVPENLLKFYFVFSGSMSRGEAYERIALLNADGEPVELPFLELAEELWDPQMTRLTLFFDPGRLKRGVTPHEEVGPAFRAGHAYQLVVDEGWPDATGQPLADRRIKAIRVGPPDYEPIDVARWSIDAPAAGSRDPLVIRFGEPLDFALLHRLLTIVDATGAPLDGEVRLREHEAGWAFAPALPWRAGVHSLLVDRVLEDLAGNSVGRAFEVPIVDAADDVGDVRPRRRIELSFEIKTTK